MPDSNLTIIGPGGSLSDEPLAVSGMVVRASAPSAEADKAKLYALDVGGTIELYVIDSAGTPTKLSG
jgi:hypothetical protein